jgi:hypothetical protein
MRANARVEVAITEPRMSPLKMISGMARQGAESFFASQKILLDLIMRQNSMTVNAIRKGLAFKPISTTPLTEFAGEGASNLIAAQRILLGLAHQQNEIIMTGVRERVGNTSAGAAMIELLRRGVDNFIEMQQHLLTLAAKQTDAVLDSARTGEPYEGKTLQEVARDALDNVVKSQKKFLDIVAEEVVRATEKSKVGGGAGEERTEMTELAHRASASMIDAQKKLLDVAGHQIDSTIKVAGAVVDMVPSVPRINIAHLTRDTILSFVEAQKALLDVMARPRRLPSERPEPPQTRRFRVEASAGPRGTRVKAQATKTRAPRRKRAAKATPAAAE